jgi:hypothetical protein
VLSHGPFDRDFDLEGVAMKPAALVILGYMGKVMGRFE